VVDGEWITSKAVDDALADVPLELYRLSEIAPREYRLQAIPEAGGVGWQEQAEAALRSLLAPRRLSVEATRELPMDESQKFRFTCPLPAVAS
jgi:hypothetical protein